ncbi:MAG: hypothetical protein JSS76_16075 [Bacteroidetes bacterium]|nr:hypothetical protein [Bacteroidota bacterium]
MAKKAHTIKGAIIIPIHSEDGTKKGRLKITEGGIKFYNNSTSKTAATSLTWEQLSNPKKAKK